MSRWVRKSRPNQTPSSSTAPYIASISKRQNTTSRAVSSSASADRKRSVDLSTFYRGALSRANPSNQQLDYDVNYLFANQCAYIPLFFKDPELTIFNELKRDIVHHHRQMSAAQNNVCHLKEITLPNEQCYDLRSMSDLQKKAMNVRLKNDQAQKKRETNDVFKASLQCYIERNVYEMPQEWSSRARSVAEALCRFYDCELIVCSMNFYKNGDDFAKFHFDKYKYHSSHQNKPDITIGASFGATRSLSFQAMADRKCTFSIEQHNGDVFSFSDKINEKFKHSVPKIKDYQKERISIIVWGKRRVNINRNVNPNGSRQVRQRVQRVQARKYHSKRKQGGPSRW